MISRTNAVRSFFAILLAAVCFSPVFGQNVKRLVVVKIDGLPGYVVDKFVKQRDPVTGHSVLPWFEEVFYKNGTRVPNFYTRGMSLSGPSWGQLDTGQHLQIKGNVEYDRDTLYAYDYLNFFPYYLAYGLGKKVDMPAVEVMDELKIPILADAFPYDRRYTSQQLYQRGNDWAILASGFVKLYPGSPDDMIDEWTLGIPIRNITVDQVERDILGKLVKTSSIDYFDYYDGAFDHISHHNSDNASKLIALKELDLVIGKMWVAIQNSSRADETALVLVSDHGINSEDKIYSQGFNLVRLLASAAGGGHHVITKRQLMLDYTIKGIYPLVPRYTTRSDASYYLSGQSGEYPTALVDFDGNERSSIHLRNSDLNVLHILLQQLKRDALAKDLKAAAANTFFQIIDRHRQKWQDDVIGLGEEMDALHRWIDVQQKIVSGLPMKANGSTLTRGPAEANRRLAALVVIAKREEAEYRKYILTVTSLLALHREKFDARKVKIEDVIAPGAMGEQNSIYDLQNYVIGPSSSGLSLNSKNELDLDKSFTRVNYFEFLHSQIVRNNVQPAVGSRPIDFIATRLPVALLAGQLPAGLSVNEDPIWLYAGEDRQALILSHQDDDGGQSYRYLPVSGLKAEADGRIEFQAREWESRFPLKYFEDANFGVPPEGRVAWLSEWHSEVDWLRAIHKTTYSNGIIGLNEQVDRHPIFDGNDTGLSQDEILIRRFRQRQRHLTEADMLIMANNHWNFDVRGFNPGGNHGSFLRVSTNSTFMIAGGAGTGIPRGLAVEEPYDGMSFMSTLLRLMGKIDDQNRPLPELQKLGFRRFPGRVVREITDAGKSAAPVK